MKKRFLYVFLLVSVLVSLVSNLYPASSSAAISPSSDHRAHALVKLSGTSTPQKYSVRGVMGTSSSVSFSYNSSQGGWLSSPLPGGVGTSCFNNTDRAAKSLKVTITLNGKSAASPFSMNFCDSGAGNTQSISVAVKSASQTTNQAYFSGVVQYKDGNGKVKRVGAGTTGTLIGGQNKQTYNLSFSNGAIRKIAVAPGTYKLQVDYPVPGGQNQNYTKTITIKPGQNYVLSNAIAGNVSNGNSNGQNPNGGSSGGGGGSTPTCEKGSFSLNWILCPIFNGVSNTSDWLLTNIIEPELKTQPLCLDTTGATCEDKNNITYKVWSGFRIYGDIFLVIALLVIVFGESIGGGVIDAYTAKKVLPRLLIATIAINLSIYIVAFLIDVTNVVAGGVGQLMTAPLNDQGAFSIQPGGVSQGAIIGGGLLATGLGGAGLVALLTSIEGGLFILVGFAIPAALAIIGVFITLAIRKAIILGLVMVAPVAFALYCLPNTEKYFRKWWDLLFQMLLLYPLIIVIFAVADILSVITGNINSNNVLNQLLSFMFLIIPLFLIPYAFKMSNGALGRIHDMVNAGRQRINGMTQNSRERARQRYGQKVTDRRNDWYNSGVANRMARTPGLRYITGRRREAVAQQIMRQNADIAKSPQALGIQHDDNALRAATYGSYGQAYEGVRQHLIAGGMNADQAETEARRAARAVQTSVGYGASQASWATQAMAQTGTAFRDIEDVTATIARASGGNGSTIASLAGNVNAATKTVGRHDLAGSFGELNTLSRQQAGLDGGAMDFTGARTEAWNSASLYQHANDKPANLEAHAAEIGRLFAAGGEENTQRAAVMLSEFRAMQPNATGRNRDIIQETLDQHGAALNTQMIDPATGGPMTRTVARRDPANPNNLIYTDEHVTLGDFVAPRVREYQRPDPNNIP